VDNNKEEKIERRNDVGMENITQDDKCYETKINCVVFY